MASDVPLLGPAFNSAVGPYAVPLTARGLAARDQVLAHIESGEYALETAPCLCGSDAEELICTVDRYYIPHRTVLCTECGLVRTNPRWTPETYVHFYTHYYRALYERPGHAAETMFAIQRENAERRTQFIVQRCGRARFGSVLEVGCGGGWNLLPFLERADAVAGFDWDQDYLAAGRAAGLDLRKGGLAEAVADGRRYDLILLSHVVEHFLDPVADLAQIKNLLAADGVLFVEVPNLFAVTRNLRRYWQSAHTYSFVPHTLRQLMGSAGYSEIALDHEIASVWRIRGDGAASPVIDSSLAGRTRRFLRSRETDGRLRFLIRRLGAQVTAWR